MGLRFGIDNLNGENRISAGKTFKTYPSFLKSISSARIRNVPLDVEFKASHSLFNSKLLLTFQNLFPFSYDNHKYNVHFEIGEKEKVMKQARFSILPSFKVSLVNETDNVQFSAKHGSYLAKRNQEFSNYNYRELLHSISPFSKNVLKLTKGYNFSKGSLHHRTFIKGSLASVPGIENSIKLSGTSNLTYEYNQNDAFNFELSNVLSLKRAFVFGNHRQNHISSNYDCYSKLLGVNLFNLDHKLNIGTTLLCQNVTTLRLTDLPYCKGHEFFGRITPFVSIETIYDGKTWPNKTLVTSGISLKLGQQAFIDFCFFTKASQNTGLENDKINKFRIQLNISGEL